MSATVGESTHDVPPAQPAGFWDGVRRGYMPQEQLEIDPSLTLHSQVVDHVDPITQEVIRYSLLNANFEHSATLARLCVSPICMMSHDYQASVMTECGDLVFLGPNVQWFSIGHEYSTKWILENRSGRPGIADGDMWLCNDPFIGAAHQPDVMIACPVFVDEKLFTWVANSMHHSDLGGITPGSFCTEAADAFQEGPCIPAVRLLRNDVVQPEIEELFVRQSRLPTAARMDLRAAIAGNRVTRSKILALVDRYGADVVKTVMHRSLDAGEQVFTNRLQAIPDGTWSHRVYTESALPGDPNVYRYQMNIRKVGSELHVDNAGTEPQAGSINTSLFGFASQFMTALCAQMLDDQAGGYGGVRRRVRFHPVPGTLNCADYPAAISPAGVYTMPLGISCATVAIGRMLASGDKATRSLILGSDMAHFATYIAAGLDNRRTMYVLPNTDGMMGSFGATPRGDGDDMGGHFYIPEAVAHNIEELEGQFPVLCVYRRILDGAAEGAGRYRGGLGFVEATIPWGGSEMAVGLCMNESFPKSLGGAGGNPGARATFRVRRGADVRAEFEAGRIPSSLNEVPGEFESPALKHAAIPIGDRDAFEWTCPTAPGYGDPLLRLPEDVVRDTDRGYLAPDLAESIYGVVFKSSVVDIAATEAKRAEMFSSRVKGKPTHQPDQLALDRNAFRAAECLARVVVGGSPRWMCIRCSTDIGDGETNYKKTAVALEHPVEEITGGYDPAHSAVASQMVFREFCCPACGVRFDTEIARVGDAHLWDARVTPGAAQ